jgi:hypothetical protein
MWGIAIFLENVSLSSSVYQLQWQFVTVTSKEELSKAIGVDGSHIVTLSESSTN